MDNKMILFALGAVVIYYVATRTPTTIHAKANASGLAANKPAGSTGNAYVDAGVNLAARYADTIGSYLSGNSGGNDTPPSDNVDLGAAADVGGVSFV